MAVVPVRPGAALITEGMQHRGCFVRQACASEALEMLKTCSYSRCNSWRRRRRSGV
jgi:hypothetical protein